MPGADEALPLVNVFEVAAEEGGTRHLLAFIEVMRAGSSGIDPRSIVGEITPTDEGGYDPRSLKLNPEFIEAFTGYMKRGPGRRARDRRAGPHAPSGWVYIIDPGTSTSPKSTRLPATSSEPSPSTMPARSSLGRSSTTRTTPSSIRIEG